MIRPDASVFAEGDGYTLLHGDATAIPLDDVTVDAIVTSPPYFALRSYTDDGEHFAGQIGSEATPQEFLEALWAVTAECRRVLKPSGSLFVNLGDKYANDAKWGGATGGKHVAGLHGATGIGRAKQATGIPAKSLMMLPHRYVIGCIDQLGLICRAEIPWSKPNGLPESVTDRVRRSHEMWFHMTKEPRYYSAVDEIREEHAATSVARSGRNRFAIDHSQDGVGSPNTVAPTDACHPLGKLPGSVWTIPSEPLMVPDYFVEDDLGPKMLDCRPLWQWVEHRVHQGDYGPVEVRPIDHFAAFPQEWPRRLILGWSPSGICCECGEGRRLVAATEGMDLSRPQARRAMELAAEHGLTDEHLAAVRAVGTSDVGRAKATQTGTNGPETLRLLAEAKTALGGYTREFLLQRPTSFGESCACDAPTAPTRPAVILDPFGGTGTTAMVARALGRHGIHLDLSLDYLRLARWRIEQSGHATKTVNRTNRDRQGTLLRGAAS